MPPLVAVCICTRSRPQMLRRCLASVCSQRLDSARLRMRPILIDNNPEPAARPIYEALCAGEQDGGYVHCPEPGIPIARNAAIEAALRAGADYIAFLDDDEVAPEHWLMALMDALYASGADAIQGGVRHRPATDAADPVWRHDSTCGKFAWETCASLATCNVLFKTWLVEPPLARRFDEAMRYTGGSDREFFLRARKRGAAKLVRVHGVDVLEDLPEGRRSLGYRAARAFAAGSNYFERVTKNEGRGTAAARIAARALDRSVTGLARLVAAAALLLALRLRSARKQWRMGCASLCFAAGCITPVAGVRAYPYRESEIISQKSEIRIGEVSDF
jgi:succinoglycan biosynthesis protein ExoM